MTPSNVFKSALLRAVENIAEVILEPFKTS